jgi:hypothetical protein
VDDFVTRKGGITRRQWPKVKQAQWRTQKREYYEAATATIVISMDLLGNGSTEDELALILRMKVIPNDGADGDDSL